MHAITSAPAARRLFAVSILARLPLTMLSIGLLVHARHLTGSFAAAGVVTGAFAVSLGVGGPLLGRLVDQRGQTMVLLTSAVIAGATLAATAALPVGAPAAAIVGLAVALGLATPPVGACMRTLFPTLLSEPEAIRSAYAAEAAYTELTWIAGPPLVLLVGAALSTGAALAFSGAILVAATAAFAAQRPSRAWRPSPSPDRPRGGGALRAPAMRTLVVVLVAVGVVFGAAEIGVAAAADALGSTAAAGPLLGIWGAGSLVGGLVAARAGGGARTGAGLALVLVGLAAGHLALAGAVGSILVLAAVLALAGATIAPTYASVFAMVDDAAPAGTVTEAFAWLNTAVAIGASAGAASAGALTDTAGPASTFVLAAAAGVVAALVTVVRSQTLGASGASATVARDAVAEPACA
jgi:predicted MFS family arabinose efflux permease